MVRSSRKPSSSPRASAPPMKCASSGRNVSSTTTGKPSCATGTPNRSSAATPCRGARKTSTAASSPGSCASGRPPSSRPPSRGCTSCESRPSGSPARAMRSTSPRPSWPARARPTRLSRSSRAPHTASRGSAPTPSSRSCAASSAHDSLRTMAETWTTIHSFEDIKYERTGDGIAKITINRPKVRNAFRPLTVSEMKEAFDMARDDAEIGVVILTGEGPDAFCSGGDQRTRGKGGYVDSKGLPRLNILDVQKQIRSLPKPVVAMVAGYAIGGGHVLHVVCDLTIAAENARFGQTGPRVGSFDGGLGSSYLARIVGQKKAREIWFLCRQYDAKQALEMGLVNTVVPLEQLEEETLQWCREMLALSPMALRLVKSSFHAHEDGYAGIQQLAHDTNLLFYGNPEAAEGREAYKAKRQPDFSKFPRRP